MLECELLRNSYGCDGSPEDDPSSCSVYGCDIPDVADDDLTDDLFNFRYLQTEDLETCGSSVCNSDEYCCNEGCSLCVPLGDECTDLDCDGAGAQVLITTSSFTGNTVSESVIVNDGGELELNSTAFFSNSAQESIISVSEGNISLNDSSFEDNLYSEGTGVISVDADSTVVSNTNNFGRGNTDILDTGDESPCSGIFIASQGCSNFDATTSPASLLCESGSLDFCLPSPNADCINTWSQLQESVATATLVNRTHTICPNTTLDLSDSSAIEISASNTTIRCGESGSRLGNCTISNGSEHFIISGSATDVIFAGLVMVSVGGSAASASILARGNSASKVSFVDCEWAANTAKSVVLIEGAMGPDDEIREIERRQLQETVGEILGLPPSRGKAMSVIFHFCLFSDNNVEFGVVTNLGGTAKFYDTKFLGNTAGGTSVIAFYDAFVSAGRTCFVGNERITGEGSIFIDKDSTQMTNVDNFVVGEESPSVEPCLGIFLDSVCVQDDCSGFCNNFVSDSCLAVEAPREPLSELPGIPIPSCYSDWNTLWVAATAGISNTYNLCQNTTLYADHGEQTSILVNGTEISTFQCGEDGAGKNCIISGGTAHFFVAGPAQFSGITMHNASDVSVVVAIEDPAEVKFTQCRWIENNGPATVVVYSDANPDGFYERIGVDPFTKALTVPGSVEFDQCHFGLNDNVGTGVLVALGGDVTVRFCAFAGNMGTPLNVQGWFGPDANILPSLGVAEVGITDSCFIDNELTLPGSVRVLSQGRRGGGMVSDWVRLERSDNYGRNNRPGATAGSAANGDCGGILTEGTGCTPFEADSCHPSVETDVTLPGPPPGPGPSPPPDGTGSVGSLEPASFGRSRIFLRDILIAVFLGLGGAGVLAYLVLSRDGGVGGGHRPPPGEDGEEDGNMEEQLRGYSLLFRSLRRGVGSPDADPDDDDAEYDGDAPGNERVGGWGGHSISAFWKPQGRRVSSPTVEDPYEALSDGDLDHSDDEDDDGDVDENYGRRRPGLPGSARRRNEGTSRKEGASRWRSSKAWGRGGSHRSGDGGGGVGDDDDDDWLEGGER